MREFCAAVHHQQPGSAAVENAFAHVDIAEIDLHAQKPALSAFFMIRIVSARRAFCALPPFVVCL
jgi:hypothetical protein